MNCQFFCFSALADKEKGILYMDVTEVLTEISLNGHQYFFIAYSYDSNHISEKFIRNFIYTTIIKLFDDIFTELDNKGYKPRFNVTYNQGTGVLEY